MSYSLQGRTLYKFFALIILCFSSHYGFANDVVRYVYSKEYPDPKNSYFVELLTLAMDASKGEFGDYTLEPVAIEMAQERSSAMLERGEYIDIAWRMTSADLEQRLSAIYVPLLKGMMGYRIFIIRSGEQSKFPKTLSLNDLKKITVGQGYNWPDSDILRYNHFELVEGYDIHLLKMLGKKRFDYFPRAIHEPWLEITENLNYVVENNFVLKYTSPIYFFVNSNNKRLKQRLDKGMGILVESGVMSKLFQQHEITSGIIAKAKLDQRKVFELENPLLSEHTKKLIADKRLWLSVE